MTSKAYEYYFTVSPFNRKRTKQEQGTRHRTKLKRALTAKTKFSIAVITTFIIVIVAVLLLLFFLPRNDRTYWMPYYRSGSKLGRYQFAAVSTDVASCASIGKEMLLKNGSAVDAAIATLVCNGAVNPQSSGLGGGFLMLIYTRNKTRPYFIDAREEAPANSSENSAEIDEFGSLSMGIPGELAGYFAAHKKFGKFSWKELFEPTIQMCQNGIRVNRALASALKRKEHLIKEHESIKNIFLNKVTGEVIQEGEVITRHDLASTLEAVVREGLNGLYGKSPLSTKFMEDLEEVGSIITETDMITYAPKTRRPVRIALPDGSALYTVPPPGSGTILAIILGVLAGYPDINANTTWSKGATVLTYHRMIETFKHAYARGMDLEDGVPIGQLVKNLTETSYFQEIRERIWDNKTFEDPQYYDSTASVTAKEFHGSAHVSVVAPNGDAVSVTSTLNDEFGSLVMSPSTGIILNNALTAFTPINAENDLRINGKNLMNPRKRPMTSISPSIIVDPEGEVKLVIGGSGGSQIVTSIAQAIMHNIWLQDDIKRSIDAPRLYHQLVPNHISYESRFPRVILDNLRKLGHKTQVSECSACGALASISRKDDFLFANSDYRKGGDVDGF